MAKTRKPHQMRHIRSRDGLTVPAGWGGVNSPRCNCNLLQEKGHGQQLPDTI